MLVSMVALGCKQTQLFPVSGMYIRNCIPLTITCICHTHAQTTRTHTYIHTHIHSYCQSHAHKHTHVVHMHTHRLGQPLHHFQNAAIIRVKDPHSTKLTGSHPCHCLTEVAVPPAWSYTLAQYIWQPAHLVLAVYTQPVL